MAEQVERLARDYEVHLYSQRVADIDRSGVVWHRVPALPAPQLLAFGWWVLANHGLRWWDARVRGLAPVLVYSPGINCFDADVVSVHVVFGEYRERMRPALRFGRDPRQWPLLLHRRAYYRLLAGLERVVYGRSRALLTVVSRKAAMHLQRYGRSPSQLPVIPHGVDAKVFNPETNASRRDSARRTLGFNNQDFCLLLIGNDWHNKGLPCLLEALSRLPRPVRLMAVGTDPVVTYRALASRLGVEDRVLFLQPRCDVGFYHAAADLYVGPSLQDAFALPPLEAMACGIPVIVSSQAGVSEIVTDGAEGFILDDPRDSTRLVERIELLRSNPGLHRRMAKAAAETARKYTWDRNAQQLGKLFQEFLERKGVAVAGLKPSAVEAPVISTQ